MVLCSIFGATKGNENQLNIHGVFQIFFSKLQFFSWNFWSKYVYKRTQFHLPLSLSIIHISIEDTHENV